MQLATNHVCFAPLQHQGNRRGEGRTTYVLSHKVIYVEMDLSHADLYILTSQMKRQIESGGSS